MRGGEQPVHVGADIHQLAGARVELPQILEQAPGRRLETVRPGPVDILERGDLRGGIAEVRRDGVAVPGCGRQDVRLQGVLGAPYGIAHHAAALLDLVAGLDVRGAGPAGRRDVAFGEDGAGDDGDAQEDRHAQIAVTQAAGLDDAAQTWEQRLHSALSPRCAHVTTSGPGPGARPRQFIHCIKDLLGCFVVDCFGA